MQDFYSIDFNLIYPHPTPERVAEAFFNRLWRKINILNFSLLITFYGPHRNGKSLASVDFAYILDPTFEKNLEQRVVYNGKDLVAAFKEIRKKKIKGEAVIVDEAGSGELSSQRWYEEAAKIINAELQAVGYLNPFIGFVTQSFSFINTTARRLSQGVFKVSRSNNEYANIKPFWISDNPWSSGIYHKYPIFCERHSRGENKVVSNVFKANRIKLGLTPQPIRHRYERHSQAYKDKLLQQSEEDMETLEISKQQKNVFVTGIDAIVKEVIANVDDYITVSHLGKNINKELIKHRHELTWTNAQLVKSLVEKQINVNNQSNKKGKTL